ncbi:hypothetical protein FISHEDRAFT_59435 [Fistulina hepatica ATCC 64428]|uniref:F-box domain-containing protein n=1 Tax=Fistulina hepatica ATCC 64428 TaxID=1128425 RepID=A0A0D7A9L6_9AGAR|nr:hypothetical protein FISHEDRAFT_59435 [Fistulina hepatica ATCC 64428]
MASTQTCVDESLSEPSSSTLPLHERKVSNEVQRRPSQNTALGSMTPSTSSSRASTDSHPSVSRPPLAASHSNASTPSSSRPPSPQSLMSPTRSRSTSLASSTSLYQSFVDLSQNPLDKSLPLEHMSAEVENDVSAPDQPDLHSEQGLGLPSDSPGISSSSSSVTTVGPSQVSGSGDLQQIALPGDPPPRFGDDVASGPSFPDGDASDEQSFVSSETREVPLADSGASALSTPGSPTLDNSIVIPPLTLNSSGESSNTDTTTAGPPTLTASQSAQDLVDGIISYLDPSPSLLSQISFLDKTLSEAIPLLRRHRNKLVPLLRLPPELLARIISHLQVYYYPSLRPHTTGRNPYAWLLATHTCYVMRQAALAYGPLWATLDFHLAQPEAARTFLARSSQAPLTIYYNPRGVTLSADDVSFFADLEQSHADRIHALHVVCCGALPERFWSLVQYAAPSLKEFSVETCQAPDDGPRPVLFANNTPSLRKLVLRDVLPLSNHIVGLTHLVLRGQPYTSRYTLEELLDILEGCPDLEELVVVQSRTRADTELTTIPAAPRHPVIDLPRLKRMELGDWESPRVMRSFLDNLRIPGPRPGAYGMEGPDLFIWAPFCRTDTFGRPEDLPTTASAMQATAGLGTLLPPSFYDGARVLRLTDRPDSNTNMVAVGGCVRMSRPWEGPDGEQTTAFIDADGEKQPIRDRTIHVYGEFPRQQYASLIAARNAHGITDELDELVISNVDIAQRHDECSDFLRLMGGIKRLTLIGLPTVQLILYSLNHPARPFDRVTGIRGGHISACAALCPSLESLRLEGCGSMALQLIHQFIQEREELSKTPDSFVKPIKHVIIDAETKAGWDADYVASFGSMLVVLGTDSDSNNNGAPANVGVVLGANGLFALNEQSSPGSIWEDPIEELLEQLEL